MNNTPSPFKIDLAAVLGCSATSGNIISPAISEAKQALGIDRHTKSLTADDKAAIIQWHKARLTDKNQLDIETIAPAVVINEPIEPAPMFDNSELDSMIKLVNTTLDNLEAFDKLEASRNNTTHIEQVETIPGVVDTIADDPAITERYDFNAMVQLSLYVGARKQCHIAIDGFYLNALMTMAGIDKKGVKEWVQNAVDSWGEFDAKLNITRQVRCLIVRELESELIKARK